MIKHIVCFKLKDNSDENTRAARDILMSMKDKEPMVRDIQVGVDFLKSARSYDIILQVELDNRETLDAYQEDPYHVGVVKEFMHKAAEASIAIDYDLD